MKKKIDDRIRILIENCVKTNHRSLFLIIGDRGLYQIVNLHTLVSKARVKAAPRVLWCYKNELEIASNKKKRVKQIKKLEAKGNLAKDEIDQIELFMSSKDIRYCFYKDSHQILGQTFGMCVLQDFESVTPNVLCRAMETVEGGGCIVMLFNTLTSLKQLYQISMDVHSRFRTEAHQVVQPRFNERFILSLSNCKSCIAIDDELNILPLTQNIKDITPVQLPGQSAAAESGDTVDLYLTKEQKELKDLQESLKNTKPIGNLVALCKTYDQASTVMQIVDNISERSLKSTVSLTAGRGRGKSAALGIALASSIVYGFSNIFVTAPSPENLQTVFEFLFKGLDALNYREHQDYDILQSTNPEFNHAVVRVNVFRDHRQTIQYIQPQDYAQLAQAELLVVDEAAAIPITLVKKMLGPYMVLLSSTIHGYEGTGRSLSLKLLSSLREQNQMRVQHQKSGAPSNNFSGRTLMETELDEPIRYGKSDPVEKWLNDLLCLDATQNNDSLVFGFPHPSQCELYYVNRDTLFSYHSSSESFLNKLMTIFVSSHYKNTPNDLQLLSDAPAHQVFVLMGPLSEATAAGKLPDILCAIQVSFEGEISAKNCAEQLKRGLRPSGDLIPWTISEQFQDDKFAQLNGIRIVRIATHPSAQGRGYGSRALDLLIKYYEGQLHDADSENITNEAEQFKPAAAQKVDLQGATLQDKLKPKKQLKPILQKLSERVPVPVHYVGTSFGVTKELFTFWKKNKLEPVYVRQTANDLTGEHTCLMIRPLSHLQEVDLPVGFGNLNGQQTWLEAYTADFRRRIVSLLGYEFRRLPAPLAFQFVARASPEQSQGGLSAIETEQAQSSKCISRRELEHYITVFDLKRLESYAKNLVDFHLIMDLVPILAKLYFLILPAGSISLSYVQAATLTGMGLQFKTIDQLTGEMGLQANQILPLFNKSIRKFHRLIKEVFELEIAEEMNRDEQKAITALGGVAVNKQAASTLGNQTLVEELMKGTTQGLGSKLASKMQDDKDKFIKQHKIKKSASEAIDNIKLTGDSTVVSIPRKRSDNADGGSDDELAAIEKKVRSKKGDKPFNNKRQKKH